MKKYFSRIFIALIIIAWIFTYIMGNSFAALDEDNPTTPNESVISPGMLKDIMMAKLSGKERIHLVVSKQPEQPIDVKSKDNGSYLIRLEDFEVAESLCRPLGEGELNNIISVVPSQQFIDGKKWVYLTIYPHEIVPYSIRQEGENVLIDFNIASIEARNASVSSSSRKSVAKVSTRQEINEVSDQAVKHAPAKKQTERIVSLDFQDADIKSVFRLMAEYGNVSIITTDEVKGNITLSMKNVPWTKALETILDINGLTKKEDDNVIIISSLARSQKDEAAREAQQELEKKRRADKGLLKQVLIEAKIVEASEEFVRNLGVQWGFGSRQRVSGSSQYGVGIVGGSNVSQSNTWNQYYPPQTPVGDLTMAAVNFPSSLASPTIGLVFGGATGFLETQLAALETNSTGKIISAPKVVTMEGMKALIKQGDEVPYITPSSGTSPATVTFKEALLKLEVTPKLTDDGKISMDIKASNDTPDWSKAALNPQGNPPIVKSEVESKVVINDGDTVVIGGILRSQDSKAVSGWPWLQKIPVLGWLFKTSDVTKTKRQLLIFVTPRILNDYEAGENQ
ncbi:MAG: secretin and TonB N-terminal domain-containing protein [Syntrophaceae bacterium]|nr:secretin and TonB N-terminal domain-containing protein [Syntrophaceae bacterium]